VEEKSVESSHMCETQNRRGGPSRGRSGTEKRRNTLTTKGRVGSILGELRNRRPLPKCLLFSGYPDRERTVNYKKIERREFISRGRKKMVIQFFRKRARKKSGAEVDLMSLWEPVASLCPASLWRGASGPHVL